MMKFENNLVLLYIENMELFNKLLKDSDCKRSPNYICYDVEDLEDYFMVRIHFKLRKCKTQNKLINLMNENQIDWYSYETYINNYETKSYALEFNKNI